MQQTRVLVVDDEPVVAEVLERYLRREGFEVSVARDGEAAVAAALADKPDLVLLDLMLPRLDGLDVFRRIRAQQAVPVIMLTAKGEETDRVVGLEMGADDYVAKPFSGRELLARIKAVLRRTRAVPRPPAPEQLQTVYRFGRWALNTAKREMESDDDLILPLSSGEYNLLLALVRHPQKVLSRDQLLDLTKGRSATPLDRSIDLQISRLRKKIEDNPKNPEIIKTAWGDGYVFTARVTAE
jgi:two-component system OmpR family response regulator